MIRVWDVDTGKQLEAWDMHDNARQRPGFIAAIDWSKDGAWLACNYDSRVMILEADSGTVRHKMTGQRALSPQLVFHPDSKRLYSTDNQHMDLHVWSVLDGVELPRLPLHGERIESLSIGGDGRLLAFKEGERAVRVVTAGDGMPFGVFRGDQDIILCSALSEDGQRLAAVCARGSIKIWDVSSPQEFAVLHSDPVALTNATLHADGRRLICNTVRKGVTLLDLQQRRAEDTREERIGGEETRSEGQHDEGHQPVKERLGLG